MYLLSFQASSRPWCRQEGARSRRHRLPLALTSCLVRVQQVFCCLRSRLPLERDVWTVKIILTSRDGFHFTLTETAQFFRLRLSFASFCWWGCSDMTYLYRITSVLPACVFSFFFRRLNFRLVMKWLRDYCVNDGRKTSKMKVKKQLFSPSTFYSTVITFNGHSCCILTFYIHSPVFFLFPPHFLLSWPYSHVWFPIFSSIFLPSSQVLCWVPGQISGTWTGQRTVESLTHF